MFYDRHIIWELCDETGSNLVDPPAILTRAQMRCGFGCHNQALIDKASLCARGPPEAKVEATINMTGVYAVLLRQFP